MSRTSMWMAFRSTRWDHWKEGLHLTVFTLVGGLAPLWIGLLLVLGYGGEAGVVRFARGGEFALYSASLLAPTIHVIVSERTEKRFVGQPTYMLVALAAILLAVAGYALIAPVAIGVIPYAGLKVALISWLTVALYGFSVLLSLVVTVLDNARSHPPVADIIQDQQKGLDRDFDKLGN
jgi:hypothetical protein